MVLGKCAFAAQAGRHRCFQQFRQFTQCLPAFGIVNPLTGIDDRS